MSEQWSDKILQGLHNASEMLAEQKRQIEELRAERDAAREQRDAAREEAKKQHESAVDQNRLLKRALVELDEARNPLDDLRTEHACLQGDCKRGREELAMARASIGDFRIQWDAICAKLGLARESLYPRVQKRLSDIVEENQNLLNELANLRTERELWHRDAERRDQDRVAIAGHESRWAEAARILGIDDDPEWNISDVLEALRGTVRTADLAATLAAGTGPVAVPSTEQAGLSGDLAGVLNVVARHSREIGTLQDDIRALRDRLAKVESRPVTSTAMGTSEGLL